jgi:hypothetical protein
MDLVHYVYCSASTRLDLDRAELQTLLDECRRNNAQLDITGILLYLKGSFFQVLEGDRSVLEALYEKILADQRHKRAITIILEPIAKRDFAAWTMGCPTLSAGQLAQIPGLNDFFTRGESYLELGEGRAKTLLKAFTEGRWRASIA